MKNAKKYICFLVLGCVLCTNAYNVYQTCYASELVVAGGLASSGTALLGLLAMAGVGMELENNRKFNELTDEEKIRIQNGLAQNYEEVALQRGASLEKIKTWTNDLCNGVLDKASECWGIFKDWAKDVHITDNGSKPNEDGVGYDLSHFIGTTWTANGNTYTFTQEWYDYCIKWSSNNIVGYKFVGVICYDNNIAFVTDNTTKDYINYNDSGFLTWTRGTSWAMAGQSSLSQILTQYLDRIVLINCSKPVYYGETTTTNINGLGFETLEDIFSTNTDYLEKLKGQEEDVIDVIDVTDIKNPIVESRGNSVANIDWSRGTRRTNNNNDDDDDKISTALVPMDVWYEAIDEEQEGMQNAIVSYNNYIEEHPEAQGNYFISTQPITNISNYYNILPVVNIPAQGTVVNNYYEYNNINNNNVTIYELPYNTELVPLLPKMIFENKFPFCIPFDIYQFFAMFYVEKEAPRITVPVPFKNEYGVFAEELVIDLSDYNYLSDVLRVMSFLLFIVGLMMVTRKLIKG